MSKKVMVILADGFEEIEAVTPVDVLRRAGIDVIIAGLSKRIVSSTRNLRIETDVELTEITDADAIILPGGMPGAGNLANSEIVLKSIKNLNEKGRIIAAICASPAFVLAPSGVLDGKKATGYPGTEQEFGDKITVVDKPVVVDGNIVTSRGPGTALAFTLKLVELLVGREKAEELRENMLAG